MPQSCPPAWYAPAALGHGSGSVTMNGAQVQARTSVATVCISDHFRLQCLRARRQPSVCYCSPVLLAYSWPLWGKQHNGMMGSCSRVRSRRSPLTLGLGRGQRRRNLREPGNSSRARGAGWLQLMHIACCWGGCFSHTRTRQACSLQAAAVRCSAQSSTGLVFAQRAISGFRCN